MSSIERSARARLRPSLVVALLIVVTGVAGSVAEAAEGKERLLPGTPLRLILEAAFSEGGSLVMASEYADRALRRMRGEAVEPIDPSWYAFADPECARLLSPDSAPYEIVVRAFESGGWSPEGAELLAALAVLHELGGSLPPPATAEPRGLDDLTVTASEVWAAVGGASGVQTCLFFRVAIRYCTPTGQMVEEWRYINLPCWSQRWTQSACVIACTYPTNFPWARLRGGAACPEVDAQCFWLSIKGKQVSRPCDTPGQMSCDCLPSAGDCPAWNIQCFDLNGPDDRPSCN
ncbi:MAG: hypothetical protein KF817_09315 [Phycisphaeraceae bacterium]|nr:hypothetical protein [Phycisphaeraceae bacterium]